MKITWKVGASFLLVLLLSIGASAQGGGTIFSGTFTVIAWDKFQDSFTGIDSGVKFDFFADGEKLAVSWTKPNVKVAFLVLPHNNQVTSARYDMFGNATHQHAHIGEKLGGKYPHPYHGNGFEALRIYDKNGDEVIDANDPVWSDLRLWFNYAGDGVYDPVRKPNEVKTLDEMGVSSIDIGFNRYHETKDTDKNGNVKRWVSKVGVKAGFPEPDIYDVALRMKE